MTSSKHSKRSKRRRIKNILSAIMSFFIAISLAAILLSIVIDKGILDYDTLKDELVRSEYYNAEIENIREGVKSILAETGIDSEVADNIVTDSIIKHDIDAMVNKSTDGNIAFIDGAFFENECRNVLKSYFEEKKVSEDEMLNQSVLELSKQLSDVYVKNMNFAIPINELNQIVSQLKENGSVQRVYLGVNGVSVSDLEVYQKSYYDINICFYGIPS